MLRNLRNGCTSVHLIELQLVARVVEHRLRLTACVVESLAS